MWRLSSVLGICLAAAAGAGDFDATVAACLSCHLDPAGQLDIVGIAALDALPEDWAVLYEDAFDLDGDGIAGRIQFVSGGGVPLVAKWGENLAAARFEDFALIAGAAHGIRLGSAQEMAAVKAAFAALSPLPGLPFADERDLARFEAAGCAGCHVTETFTFAGAPYMPLSDFLLHDMGEGPKRTAPLWGCDACLWSDPHAHAPRGPAANDPREAN